MRSSGRRTALAGLALAAAVAARAQEGGAPVTLRISPKVGDTLHTRFEQDVVMTGVTKVHGVDTSLVSRASLLVLARVVVQASDSAGCTLLVITDSVSALTVGEQALTPSESSRRAMQGRRIQLRLKRDGSAAFMDAPPNLDPEVGALVAAMPAVLPARAVAVGASWESAMAVPVDQDPDAAHGARLRASYRLDSLSAGGSRAYIGLRGIITRDSADAPVRSGARLASRGAVTGALVLDRARGWWTDSRLVISMGSTFTPPPGSDGPPVRVKTLITQRMRTEDAHAGGAPPD